MSPQEPTATAVSRRKGPGLTGWAANYVDERTGVSVVVREFGRKIFPDHWSFMLGEVSLYSFVVILVTGAFLTLFYQASMAEVVYSGSYVPLKGMPMSAALQSSLNISFEVRGGLLVRQIHHWAALLFIASTGLHMLRVFFTGAFRKPREFNFSSASRFSLRRLEKASPATRYLTTCSPVTGYASSRYDAGYPTGGLLDRLAAVRRTVPW